MIPKCIFQRIICAVLALKPPMSPAAAGSASSAAGELPCHARFQWGSSSRRSTIGCICQTLLSEHNHSLAQTGIRAPHSNAPEFPQPSQSAEGRYSIQCACRRRHIPANPHAAVRGPSCTAAQWRGWWNIFLPFTGCVKVTSACWPTIHLMTYVFVRTSFATLFPSKHARIEISLAMMFGCIS